MPNERSYETACKRSDEIRADLPLHPEKYTMLTGVAAPLASTFTDTGRGII